MLGGADGVTLSGGQARMVSTAPFVTLHLNAAAIIRFRV